MDGIRAKPSGRRRHPVAKIKGGWSKEEDDLLRGLVEEIGEGNWSAIARALNAVTGKDESNGRIGKQCRERFNHHLRPGLTKEAWTVAEEELLVQAHRELGNRWSDIARRIPGRSENSVKNHWNATLRRRDAPEPNPGPLKVYMQGLHLLGPGGGSRGGGGHSGGSSRSAGKGGKRGAPGSRSAAAMCDDSDAETTEEEEEEVLEQMLAEEDAMSSGDEGGRGGAGGSGISGGGVSTRSRKRRIQPARGSAVAGNDSPGAILPAHGSSASLTNYALSNVEDATQASGEAAGAVYSPPHQRHGHRVAQPHHQQSGHHNAGSAGGNPGWGLPVTTSLTQAAAGHGPQPPAPGAGDCHSNSVFTVAQAWQQMQQMQVPSRQQVHAGMAGGSAAPVPQHNNHLPHAAHAHHGSLANAMPHTVMGSLPSAPPSAAVGPYGDYHMGSIQHGGPRLMRRRSTAGSRLHELVKLEQEGAVAGEEAATGQGMAIDGMILPQKSEQQYHVPPEMAYNMQYQQELQEREALAAGVAAAGADTNPYMRMSCESAHVPSAPLAAPPPHPHSPPSALISPRTSSNGPNVPLGQTAPPRAFNNSSRPAAPAPILTGPPAAPPQHNMCTTTAPARHPGTSPHPTSFPAAGAHLPPASTARDVPAAPSPPPLLPPSVNAAAAAAAPGEGGAALLNALVTPGEDDMVEDDADLLALLAHLHDVPTPPPLLAGNNGDNSNNLAPLMASNLACQAQGAGQLYDSTQDNNVNKNGTPAAAAAAQRPQRATTHYAASSGGKHRPGANLAPPAAGAPTPTGPAPPTAPAGVPRNGSQSKLYQLAHQHPATGGAAPHPNHQQAPPAPPPPKGYLIDECMAAAGGYGGPRRSSGGGGLLFDDSTTGAVSRSGSNSSFYSTYGPPPRSPPKGGGLRRCAASSSNLTTMAAMGGGMPPQPSVHHHHSLPTILDSCTEGPTPYASARPAPQHGPVGGSAYGSWDGGSESQATHTMLGGPASGHSLMHPGTSPPSAAAAHHAGVAPPPPPPMTWGGHQRGAGGGAPAQTPSLDAGLGSDDGPMTVDLSSPCGQMRVLITDQPLPAAEVLLTAALPSPEQHKGGYAPPASAGISACEEVKLGSMGPLRADLQAIMARAGAATGVTPTTTQEALSAMGSLLMGVLTGNAEAAAAATAAACGNSLPPAHPHGMSSQGAGGRSRHVQQALLALRLGLDTPRDQYSVVVVLRGPRQAPLQAAAQVLSSEMGALVCH